MAAAPSLEILIDHFNKLTINAEKSISKKLKDASSTSSNATDPHYRSVVIPGVSRLVFANLFGKTFSAEENKVLPENLKKSSPTFAIKSLQRTVAILGAAPLVKCHSSNDITAIVPWLYLNNEFKFSYNTTADGANTSINKEAYFSQGRLIIPLSFNAGSNTYKVFIPCGGPDPLTDQLPDYVESYHLDEIFPVVPEQLRLNKAVGTISLITGQDWAVIQRDQVCEGDYVFVRGVYLKLRGVGTSFTSDEKNSLRFTTDAMKNVNKQGFSIAKMPKVQGRIVVIPETAMKLHRPVSIALDKIDSEDVGNIVVKFQNACFNSLGFLTHDTAIYIEENHIL